MEISWIDEIQIEPCIKNSGQLCQPVEEGLARMSIVAGVKLGLSTQTRTPISIWAGRRSPDTPAFFSR